ncbi:hypothetical protein GW17_00057699 [Ensete ventricosum]|nr:hypothetical protein GW17_00057699 [Ensete ventricosum]
MRTGHYRAVNFDRQRPIEGEIDRQRSISVVVGRLREKSTVGGRFREKKKEEEEERSTSFPCAVLTCASSRPSPTGDFLSRGETLGRRSRRPDVSGATALSSSAASSDLYGTQWIGLYGKIRSWKAVS